MTHSPFNVSITQCCHAIAQFLLQLMHAQIRTAAQAWAAASGWLQESCSTGETRHLSICIRICPTVGNALFSICSNIGIEVNEGLAALLTLQHRVRCI